MESKKTDKGALVLSISVVLMLNAMNFPIGLSGSSAQILLISADRAQENEMSSSGEKEKPQNTHPVTPPNNDAEMVIKPDVPADPEAVVTPPVVDPEMALDPTTRQPMTEEKLERLTPKELEENAPGEKQQDFQNK